MSCSRKRIGHWGILLALPVMAVLCAGTSAGADGQPELPPGAGSSAEQGYTRREPGHWELTERIHFGPLEPEREAGGITVAAALTGDGDEIVFTFTGADGARSVQTVTPYWFPDRCYAGDSFSVGVNITRDPDEDSAPGGVTAALAFAELAPGEGGYGFVPTVRSYFTTARGDPVERFGIDEGMTFSTGSEGKYYIDLHGRFPEGGEDGQTLYALLGAQDDIDRETRVFIAYEYVWSAEPEDIEVPPGYGPIEYFDEPVSTAARYPVLLTVPAAALIVIVITAVRRRR